MYTFAHVELPTTDLALASKFYGALFHWTFKTFYTDDYQLIYVDGEAIGGLTQVHEMPPANEYFNYVEVADIDQTLIEAEPLGGKMLRPKSELPAGMGWYAILRTPDGYHLGIWQKVA
jgi:uncharacterized protein